MTPEQAGRRLETMAGRPGGRLERLDTAELDAAVATAMGRQPQILPDARGVMHCMVPYPQDCAPDAMVAFRPSRGGAAAWEVWVWLVAQCHGDAEIAGALVADQQNIADDYDPEHVPTYTCRAVVALGGRRDGGG